MTNFFFVHLNFPNLNFESSILLRFLQSSQYAQKTKHNQFNQKTFLIEKPSLFFQVGENKKKSSKIKVWMQWYETNHSLKQKASQPDHCRHVPKAGLTTHFGLIWKVGRGCRLENSGPQPFPKWPQFGSILQIWMGSYE